MTRLPALHDWDSTRDALHRAAQSLALVQKAFSPSLPNAQHLSLLVRETGLITRPLRFGRMAFNFNSGEIDLEINGQHTRLPIHNQTPRTLHAALLNQLTASGITGVETVKSVDDDKPLEFDATIGQAYAAALWAIYTVIARVRGDWMGTVTPMVVWPHGFDLSTLYFPANLADEHTQPHLNLGFSPSSTGFPRPYIYAYIWPIPENLTATPLPAPARWTSDGWTGVIIDYDNLRAAEHPLTVLETTLREIFSILAGRL